jgi:hypothetical protein
LRRVSCPLCVTCVCVGSLSLPNPRAAPGTAAALPTAASGASLEHALDGPLEPEGDAVPLPSRTKALHTGRGGGGGNGSGAGSGPNLNVLANAFASSLVLEPLGAR